MNNIKKIKTHSNKKGVISIGVGLIWLAVILIGGLAVVSFIPQQAVGPAGTTSEEIIEANQFIDLAVLPGCPSDSAYSLTWTMQNILNKTGAETFDTTTEFYEVLADGSEDDLTYNEFDRFKVEATASTSTAVTLTCAHRYAAKVLSTSGAGGDQSTIRSIVGTPSGVKDAIINDGVLIFTTTGDSGTVTAGAHQNGAVESRVKDLVSDLFILEASTDDATVYNESDGANWTTATNNDTGLTVGTGGEYNIRLYTRATSTDENVNDRGIYYLVNADTGTWDVPSAKFDGTVTADIANTGLNPDEVKAYSAAEYIYLLPASRDVTNKNEVLFELQVFAESGTNPSGDILDIDLAPIGSYRSVGDNNLLKKGAVDDSSSRSDIYTRQDNLFTVA